MFSRFYQRNFGSNESLRRPNRVRITLEDRLNSNHSSFQHDSFDETITKRQNTVRKLSRDGTQQIFQSLNIGGNITNNAMIRGYNSNIVNNNISNRQLSEFYSQKSIGLRLVRSKTVKIPDSKTPTKLTDNLESINNGDISNSDRASLEFFGDKKISSIKIDTNKSCFEDKSENERINSNREPNILSFGLFHVDSQPITELNNKNQCLTDDHLKERISKVNVKEKQLLIEKKIPLYKQELPSLEIIPDETKTSNCNEYKFETVSLELYKLKELIFGVSIDNTNKNRGTKLNKAAFVFIKFNLLFHLAAIVIQCYFRRYLCKKYYKLRKIGPIEVLSASALQIQACWRSFLTRYGIYSNISCEGLNNINTNKNKLVVSRKKDSTTIPLNYKWSYYHQKYFINITNKRKKSAKIIQFYWKDIYLHKFEIKRNIILNSILSARYLAKETIEKYIAGYIVRKKMDSKYKLVPIKWNWNVKSINSVHILIKINEKWSNPKKMWFSTEENSYKYNLYLSTGNYQLVFKITCSGEGSENNNKSEILCNSTLETIQNDEFQFVNVIRVDNNYNKTSALKYFREVICESLYNSFILQDKTEIIDYISLSPNYNKKTNYEIKEMSEIASPSNYYIMDINSTPSTNVDFSPSSDFIH
ncbi:hypothetical protein FG379_000944 [Cryptosporidium bovis]|uniref:uncharacterized protein n=1 Tax=Cryptosporidium bovis TaxID=310047 RepID=UPI00351A1C6A|nr:hypothetical protein FG379_000944 [Cryptosporidium bovis]